MGFNNYVELGKLKSRNGDMLNIINNLYTIAEAEYNVMIIGEHGSGRDTVAHTIHELSPQSSVPMNVIECNGVVLRDIVLPPDCITYVNEINLLGRKQQNKLKSEMLRVQSARVIASADSTLGTKIDDNKFYLELYSMITQIRVGLPTLLQRKEDIDYIVRDALAYYNKKYLKKVKIDSRSITLLKRYRYPGNITELYNIIERAVLVNKSGIIKTSSIISILDMESVAFVTLINDSPFDYDKEMDRFSKHLISNALLEKGSVKGAAALLNLNYRTLLRKCRELNIDISNKSEESESDINEPHFDKNEPPSF